MTKATPAVTTKKDDRKTCTVCSKRYTPSHRSALTCGEECKRARRNVTRLKTATKKRKPKLTPVSNGFLQLLIRHGRQARTAQIVQYISTEELNELRQMYTLQRNANSWSSRKWGDYHFSHIYPVNGKQHTGKFVPQNLVIGKGTFNRTQGTTYFGGGEFISPAHKSSKWDIRADMTDLEVIELMIQCIGADAWEPFAKAAKLAPSQKQAHLDTLGKLLDRTNPEHAAHLRVVDDPRTSAQTLGQLITSISGKEQFQMGNGPYVNELIVLVMEHRRLAVHRPELLPFLKALEQVLQMSQYFRQSFDLDEFDGAMFFDVLHGKPITGVTLDLLNEFIVNSLTQIYDASRPKLLGPTPYQLMSPEERAAHSERVAANGRALEELRLAREQEAVSQPYWLDDVPEFQQAA